MRMWARMTGATRLATIGRRATRRQRAFGAVAAASALTLLAACGSGEGVDVDDDNGDTGDDAGIDTGEDGDEGSDATLVAAISSQPDQFDPHQTSAYPSFRSEEHTSELQSRGH